MRLHAQWLWAGLTLALVTTGCFDHVFSKPPTEIIDAGRPDGAAMDAAVGCAGQGAPQPDAAVHDGGLCNGGKLVRTDAGFVCNCQGIGRSGPFCESAEDDGGGPSSERVLAISSLYYVTCALMESHSVRCWGRNEWGGVGDGTRTDRNVASLVHELSRVAQVDVGLLHACAVLDDGSVRCWGANSNGQLHDGSNNDRTTPVVAQGITNVAQVSLGESQSCVRHMNDSLECWMGVDNNGLGAASGTQGVKDVEAGFFVTTAWLANGTLRNWGHALPTVPAGAQITRVASGYSHICALTDAGLVYCAGSSFDGQVGEPEGSDGHVKGIADAIDLAAGFEHTCVLLRDGSLRCWGQNERGQLGDGTTDDRTLPVSVVGEGHAVQVQCGRDHTCARHADGTVVCWGSNQYGQLGDGTANDSSTPVGVRGF